MKIKRFCYLFLTIGLLSSSCDKENIITPSSPNVENYDTGGGNTGGENNTTLYLYISSTGTNLDYTAGRTLVYFESNTEWTVSLDNSHFGASASVSPTSGRGKGSVTVTYGEESDHYDCSDYLRVNFRYVDKVNSNGDKHYSTKTYTITRRYHRTRP